MNETEVKELIEKAHQSLETSKLLFSEVMKYLLLTKKGFLSNICVNRI